MPSILWCGRPPTRYRLSTSDDKRADYHTLSYNALSAGERTLWFKPLWLAYIRVLHPAVSDLETEDSFRESISSLYLLMFAKLALDSVFCINFGFANDDLSVICNLFVVFILAITALSQTLYKTCAIITVGMIPMLLIYLFSTPLMPALFSLKTVFLGFMMLVYVAVYNMSIVTKGLRQPKRMARVENKALNMLADLKDNEPEAAESLMKRLTPDVRQKIITHASEHLYNEELNRVAWDQVCDGLTFSEKEICKLILQGHTLKEICAELNKSESNITSQRCHIRKKLNMDRRDDLRRTLEVRFYDAQKQVKKSEAE